MSSYKALINGAWKNVSMFRKTDDLTYVTIIDTPDQHLALPSSHVKRVVTITEEQVKANNNLLPNAHQFAMDVVKEILPSELDGIKLHENCIMGYYDSVSIESQVYEIATIGAFREVAGWSVTSYKRIAATYHEPEDIITTEIGRYPNYWTAVQKFVEIIFNHKINDFFEKKSDEALGDFLS